MEQNEVRQTNATTGGHGPNGNPDPRSESPERGGSAEEWAEIGRRIEQQLRRDAARLVGAAPSDDWGSIKGALLGKVKDQTSEIHRSEVTRRVTEVGREVEERLRNGLAEAAGAGPDADWAAIAHTLRQRVESAIDPLVPSPPGGSGTGASAEDAGVPAAAPSADRGSKSAAAGGEDTGQPMVVEETGERPHEPPPR